MFQLHPPAVHMRVMERYPCTRLRPSTPRTAYPSLPPRCVSSMPLEHHKQILRAVAHDTASPSLLHSAQQATIARSSTLLRLFPLSLSIQYRDGGIGSIRQTLACQSARATSKTRQRAVIGVSTGKPPLAYATRTNSLQPKRNEGSEIIP